jgi:hypothetical protein
MATMDNQDLVLHKIRAKLYPNHLQGKAEGQYIARTENERTLGAKDICTTAKTRGGYPGSMEELLEHVNWFNAEVAYQLADGYAVSNDWYTIYPHIGGTFESPRDKHDPEKNKISFRFSPRKRLRDIIKNISVEIQGVADTNGFINYLIDQEDAEFGHNMYLPGNMVAIYGSKIKIAGDNPGNGVFFVPVDDPSRAVKMARMGDNNPARITGIAPDTQCAQNRIEIRTQYNGTNNTFLKEPRVIASVFVLEHM